MKEQANPKLPEIKGYFSRNPGALFILVFQALIFLCAFYLTQESTAIANVAAILAYCFLVVGVVLQAISFIGHKESGRELR